MSVDLKKFLRRGMIFAVPFLLYGVFITIIDPYNYFSLPSPVNDGLKKEISFKLNYAMWKMLDYRKAPQNSILLGDSRMMAMDETRITEISGIDFYNLAYGGGSLKEALATFWFADGLGNLENVYIGLDLNSYNASDNKDRVSEVLAALNNPLLYISNTNTLLSAYRLLKASLSGKPTKIGTPKGDKMTFWRKQLEVTARVYFANYRDPLEYRKGFKDLSVYCREKGINLVFIIFPSHMDLQDKISHYGLEEDNSTFRKDLASFGLVYDFAWDNEVTRDWERFKDPYHFTQDVEDSIIRTVWGGESHFVRVFGRPTSSGTQGWLDPTLQGLSEREGK